jgi:hypothetical protein
MFHLLRPDRVYFNQADAQADQEETRLLSTALQYLQHVGPTDPAVTVIRSAFTEDFKRAA